MVELDRSRSLLMTSFFPTLLLHFCISDATATNTKVLHFEVYFKKLIPILYSAGSGIHNRSIYQFVDIANTLVGLSLSVLVNTCLLDIRILRQSRNKI